MDNRNKSYFCDVNTDKACILTELANLIYNKVEKNQVHGIETIQHELCQLEVKDLQVEELEEVMEKNHY